MSDFWEAILYAGQLIVSRKSTALSSNGLEKISIPIFFANKNNFLYQFQGVVAFVNVKKSIKFSPFTFLTE